MNSSVSFLRTAILKPLNFKALSFVIQLVHLGLYPSIVYVCYHLLSSVYFSMCLYTLLGASLPCSTSVLVCLFVPLIYFRMVSVSLRLCQEQTKV